MQRSTLSVMVSIPALEQSNGLITATSLQVAEHFGKQHKDVLRAIRNLECSEKFTERNFALSEFLDSTGRKLPMFSITRDGFAMLAMGFTGKDAARWREAYITAFNAMEVKLRALYVEPLASEKEFRNGISLRNKLTLQEQSRKVMALLLSERLPEAKRNLYWQLRQVNDALGIPTEHPAQLLGPAANTLSFLEDDTEY